MESAKQHYKTAGRPVVMKATTNNTNFRDNSFGEEKDEAVIVERIDQMNENMTKRLQGIQTTLEQTKDVANTTAEKMNDNHKRLTKSSDLIDVTVENTKISNKLLSKLTWWKSPFIGRVGASVVILPGSNVGRNQYIQNKKRKMMKKKKKQQQRRRSIIPRLLRIKKGNKKDKTNNKNNGEKDLKQIEGKKNKGTNSLNNNEEEKFNEDWDDNPENCCSKKSSAIIDPTVEQDDALDAIDALLDGLKVQADEFKTEINYQGCKLNHIQEGLDSAHAYLDRANTRTFNRIQRG